MDLFGQNTRKDPITALSHILALAVAYMHLCVEYEAHRQLCHTLPSSGQTSLLILFTLKAFVVFK